MAPVQTGAAKTAAGGSSIRGRTKHEQDQQRKTVYRPVLDNPLTVSWPPLPASIRKAILDQLLPILSNSSTSGDNTKTTASWRAEEHAARRGRTIGKGKDKGKGKEKENDNDQQKEAESNVKVGEEEAAASTEPPKKKVKVEKADRPMHEIKTRTSTYSIPTREGQQLPQKSPRTPSAPPPILDYLVVGINEVTKALESRIRWGRWELGDLSATPGGDPTAPPDVPTLIPTAAGAEEPVSTGHVSMRKRAKANKIAFSLSTTAKLGQPIDYSSLPGYDFLSDTKSHPTPPTRNKIPPYYLQDASSNPCPRILVNSESLRFQRKSSQLSEDAAGEPLGLHSDKSTSNKSRGVEGIPLIDLIFVCKPDINPPSLVAHLPTMVAAANGVCTATEAVLEAEAKEEKKERKGKEPEASTEMDIDQVETGAPEAAKTKRPSMSRVQIIPLDVGAERKLADALGLRRVAAIGLCSSAPGSAELVSYISQNLTPLSAPWLVPHLLSTTSLSSHPAPPSRFVPTHIKHLKTTAPLNPRAAHQKKKEEKKARKAEEKRKRKEEREGDEGEGDVSYYVAED